MRLLTLVLLVAAAAGAQDERSETERIRKELARSAPLEPGRALESFRIRPGFRMDLVASEPVVVSPVDMAFDENGRLFVVEMIDYPYGDKEGNPPQGRVRVLDDDDGDGRFERATVLAERLRWPTGLALWDGGVFVASVPDVLYFKDTDGDGKADRREVVLSGFGDSNVQGLVNNIKWGLDNWFHGNTSSSGGRVRSRQGAEALDLRGRDFRFRPSGEFEAETGGGLFGNTFDDFGRRFVCRNWYPVYHVVLEDRYLRRNPHLAVPDAAHYIAPNPDPVHRASPPEAWRSITTRMFLSGQLPGRLNDPTGRSTAYFTAASGGTLYRGTALGEACVGNLFVGEPATNLIHRKRVIPDGVTYRTERVEKGVEFIASTDNWFRPVNFAHGPDGALYVCDMYREIIEIPTSIPETLRRHLDVTNGKDRGRIWRITRDGAPGYVKPRLGAATTGELVDALRRPDAWWRETASRLLFHRQDRSAAPALERLASGGETPATRAAALWALDGLRALTAVTLLRAFEDRSPDVREQAVRLAEGRADALNSVLAAADDPSLRVRFQAALTLGEFRDDEAADALARLARRDGGDRFVRSAILSSAAIPPDRPMVLLRALSSPPLPAAELLRSLASMVGARNDLEEVTEALRLARGSAALFSGLGEGLRRAGLPVATLPGAEEVLNHAEVVAADCTQELDSRLDAVRILGQAPFAQAERGLAPLLEARQPSSLQVAAVQALRGFADPRVGERLIAAWKGLAPAARPDALAWFGRPERLGKVMEALEEGRIAPSDVGTELRRSLTTDARHGTRAVALLGGGPMTDRRKVIATYLPSIERPGDAARGREVYRKTCAPCHKANGEGREVGPDLSTVKERSPEELLVAILDPNREINPQFLHYKILTKGGLLVDGVIAAESATSVTLRRAEGESVTLLRSDIENLASSNLSLMPDGLERGVDPEQMADLIRFLRQIGEN